MALLFSWYSFTPKSLRTTTKC